MIFEQFLKIFIPKLEEKSRQVNLATWLLETTGNSDVADLKSSLEIELRLLFNDRALFDKLLTWDQDASFDPLQKRQLNVLIRLFKPHLVSRELLELIAQKETELMLRFSNFRPEIDGKKFSENDIREVLKKEDNPEVRQRVWEASKLVGRFLAPSILELVRLRNQAAKSLGYSDYFVMQLALQEVDERRLFHLLEGIAKESELFYSTILEEIFEKSSHRFGVSREFLGPWAWSEPFCQEDPLDTKELDQLVDGIDILETSKHFYAKMGLDVEEILKRSDHFERQGKNPHAFCIHIDRRGDIRTLNNVRPSIKWLETVLHELGHAVYEMGFDEKLPWLLKEPPHMITTEAMALLAGRQAYRVSSLNQLIGPLKQSLKEKAEKSLHRRQLIFSRWVLTMTYFERELYRDPEQDLNDLWWNLVKKYQKIHCLGSASGCDWAAKFHIGLAPVYYFSYLLGELFASLLEEREPDICSNKMGCFLKEKLFFPGNSLRWDELITSVTGKSLTEKAWTSGFLKTS